MTSMISQEEISAIQNDIAEIEERLNFGEPRDYYENYLDNEFERGHK